MLPWYKAPAGSAIDPALRTIGRRLHLQPAEVSVIWHALLQHCQNGGNGMFAGFDAEAAAGFLDLETDQVEACAAELAKRFGNPEGALDVPELKLPRTASAQRMAKKRERDRGGNGPGGASQVTPEASQVTRRDANDSPSQVTPRDADVTLGASQVTPEASQVTQIIDLEIPPLTPPETGGAAVTSDGKAAKPPNSRAHRTNPRALAQAEPERLAPTPLAQERRAAFWAGCTEADQHPIEWRIRLQGWATTGFWLPQWGPKPDERSTDAPTALIAHALARRRELVSPAAEPARETEKPQKRGRKRMNGQGELLMGINGGAEPMPPIAVTREDQEAAAAYLAQLRAG